MAERTVTRSSKTYEQLRERIRAMAPGVPLPPVPELLAELAVSQSTLDKAYARLEVRGLIERRPRKGVFAADPAATGEVAIVLRPHLFGAGASPAYRMAAAALTEALHEQNARWQVRMHLGRPTATGEEFPATLDLLEPNVLPRLRAVFALNPLYELHEQLEREEVPVVLLGRRGKGCKVTFDMDDFLRQCVAHLGRRQCESVGMLWVAYTDRQQGPWEDRGQVLLDLAASHGLECHREWMPLKERRAADDVIPERDGYELFMRFWELPDRPQGLIVPDDVMCAGVLRAVLQLGIRLPADLRLITYANRGVPLPYHEPVTRIEFDVCEKARHAVAMMAVLLHGEEPECKEVFLSGRFMAGMTT